MIGQFKSTVSFWTLQKRLIKIGKSGIPFTFRESMKKIFRQYLLDFYSILIQDSMFEYSRMVFSNRFFCFQRR
jgi:hypothetical protein